MVIEIPLIPITKKNHQQIFYTKVKGSSRKIPRVVPSKQYRQYEADCEPYMPVMKPIDYMVNVQCVYYMPTRRRVDLVNLLESTLDILVKYGVLEDDNSNIVACHDGCRVAYDKEHPRTVITIERVEE